MSNENSAEKRHGMAWPMVIVIMVLGMAGGMGLALLLIPQLSVRAAVTGCTIALDHPVHPLHHAKGTTEFSTAKWP